MIRVKVVIPNAGMDRTTLDQREIMLSSAVSRDTRIAVDCIKEGPRAIESSVDEVLAAPEVLKEVIRAKEDGFDAVVIYCFSDPGLHAARQLVDIPVIGPGEAALALAGMMGRKFSLITTLQENVSRVAMRIKESGWERLELVSVRSLDMGVLDLRTSPDVTIGRLMEASGKAIHEDGADMIILGCLGLAGYGVPVQARYAVPVIDPAFTSVAMAELFAKLSLRHSKIAFPLSNLSVDF